MKPEIRSLYFQMKRLRLIEEAIAELYAEQTMRCPVHLSIGQEGVAAGVAAVVQKHDIAMSGHRSHAHYMAKGGSLKAMMAEFYGKADGCCRGKGGSMHLIDRSVGFIGAVPIVGSTIPIAVGTAFASKLKGENKVTLAFFGEGATEEGVFHESINFASLHQLPIVFVCENNLYSVYSPMSVRQPAHREVYQQAIGHGVESFCGDGNDVEEVVRMMRQAVDKARAGQGPTFLEFKTYRWREHCGPGYDNHIGYRTEEEFQIWKKVCPIARFEEKYGRDCMLTEQEIAGIHQELEDAVKFAKASPFPAPESLYDEIYA